MSPFYKTIFNGWSKPNWATYVTLPLMLLYRILSGLRNLAYGLGMVKSHKVGVPVVIVGNISVGGTGKTPLTVALVDLLIKQGFKPGVISRGYGGKAIEWPQVVTAESNPHYMGDEAVLIATQQKCPVVVGPVRVKAAQKIIEEFDVDIIISDDGLQHKALARDIEIAVVDMQRFHKNLLCLPSGPLRDPVSRLNTVDMVIQHRGIGQVESKLLTKLSLPEDEDLASIMRLEAGGLSAVKSPVNSQMSTKANTKKVTMPLPPARIHAVAGIGHPQRFFKLLTHLGYDVIEHAFVDHHEFAAKDFDFVEDESKADIIVMTEKDAVKCKAFATEKFFYLPVQAKLNDHAEQRFLSLLNKVVSK